MPDPTPAADSFETPLGEPTRVRSADIPEEAVQAAARAMVTIYQGFQADGATRVDEEAARAALEAAAPAVASQVRREVAEQIAAAIEARRCSMDNQFCGSCSCRQEDAALAREIGEDR